MSDEQRSDFERELGAALERTAPEPRPDTLHRVLDETATVRQRPRWRAALASSGTSGWQRGLAFAGVGAAALVVGMVIGASGLLPTGELPSPTPDASARPPEASRSPIPGPAGWTEIVLDASGTGGAGARITGGLAWDGGVVLTGHSLPPPAEGIYPLAWHSEDGTSWARAAFVGDRVPLPVSIGPVVDAGDRLLAFGSGRDAEESDVTLLYVSTDRGATWNVADAVLPGHAVIADVIRFKDQFVAVGGSPGEPSAPVVWSSTDGEHWQHAPLAGQNGPLVGRFTAIASDGDKLVMLGSAADRFGEAPRATVLISIDARTWTVGELPATNGELRDLVYFAQSWHAVGSDAGRPASWWSADGYTWRSIPFEGSDSGSLTAIGVGLEGVVAVGDAGGRAVVWRSFSGQRWEPGEVLADPGALGVVLAAPSGVLVAGTSDASGTSQPVAWLHAAEARTSWSEPPAYSFVFNDQDCGGGERNYLGLMRVYVEDGVTLEYVALDDTAQRFSGSPDEIPTLGDLLARVAEAENATEPVGPSRPGSSPSGSLPVVQLTTDPVDGHPVRIHIDWVPEGVDDEECYVIDEYEVRTAIPAFTEPDRYSFVFEARCGFRVLHGQFRAFVENGQTYRYESLDQDAEFYDRPPEEIPTLGQMMERAAQAVASAESTARVVTDPVDGHPVEVEIDWIIMGIDDEECYDISEYMPEG